MIINNKNCWIETIGDISPAEPLKVVILAGEKELTNTLENILKNKKINIIDNFSPFVLVGFESDNWDHDFTPWSAPKVFKGSPDFSGGAKQTLEFIMEHLIPYVRNWTAQKYNIDDFILSIMGYSLGGLFALWAFHESNIFTNCAACSASMWYEGFDEYIKSHHPPKNSRVYLSLGKKEELTKNKHMKSVGNATREAAKLFEESIYTIESTLHWNEGGHFDDITARLAHAYYG